MLQDVLQKVGSMQKLVIAGYAVHPLILAGAGLVLVGGITALTIRKNRIAKQHGYKGNKLRMVNTPSVSAPSTAKAF